MSTYLEEFELRDEVFSYISFLDTNNILELWLSHIFSY